MTAVLVIAISTCIGIATAQDSDMRMKVAVVYPDYDDKKTLIRQIIIRSFDILRWHSIMSARCQARLRMSVHLNILTDSRL